ncbi:hypothetical protein OH76DRAFT_104167 [Lentinus brumalis]|nr:hypothetical protein OH76DRAFT_104167 [Polyporus brumalis]
MPSPAHNLDTHVYFVVGLPDEDGTSILPGLQPNEGEQEVGDGVTAVPQLLPVRERVTQHAQGIVSAPSHAAQLKVYARRQNQEHAYYDGRYRHNMEKDTRGPPISMFHPSFALFLARLNGPTEAVPLDEDLVGYTYQFMAKSTAIYLKESERVDVLSDLFTHILRREVETKRVGSANPDGSLSFEFVIQPGNRHIMIPVAIFEYKVEPGSGGCDAGVQALSAIENFWLASHKSDVRKRGCCPTFGVAMDGPWMRIYGAVLAGDRWIYQPLLPAVYTAISSKLPATHILSVCRVLQAFRDAIDDICRRTEQNVQHDPSHPFSEASDEKLANMCPTTRALRPTVMTPAPTTCGSLALRYEHVLDQHNLTYLATLTSDWQSLGLRWPRVVVKFVERYGEAAHRLLEREGFAPKLLYCGKPYADTSPEFSDMDMVVMEALPDDGVVDTQSIAVKPPAEARRKVRDAVNVLHRHGYVHGNVTWRTVYVARARRDPDVRLLNFDYAGKAGEVRYSLYLPQMPEDVKLPDDVAPMKLVTVGQDRYFLEKLFAEK